MARPKRIARIEHDSDGWWIILRPGWKVRGDGTHAIVETRKADALDKMSLVVRCDCTECTEAINV